MDFYAKMAYIMYMSNGILQVILNERARLILADFTDCFGARIAYYDVEGREIVSGRSKGSCSYCAFIRKRKSIDSLCRCLDRNRMREVAAGKLPVYYTCHGGMVEAISPVLIGNRLAGFVMFGQLRISEEIPGPVRKMLGNRCEQADRMFNEMPRIGMDKVPALVRIFSLVVRAITMEGISEIQGKMLVEKIILEAQKDPEKRMVLAEAARMTGYSESSVSHTFKKRTGKSFKATMLNIRIEKAKKILVENPHLSVKAVAGRMGYSDEFYFSRIFKKMTGIPPSRYVSSLNTRFESKRKSGRD